MDLSQSPQVELRLSFLVPSSLLSLSGSGVLCVNKVAMVQEVVGFGSNV